MADTPGVKPKIGLVTLGVKDVARSVAFYRDGLGFPTHNYTPDGHLWEVAFNPFTDLT